MLLSIVIPTYNGQATLVQTLEKIVSQISTIGGVNTQLEVVICDDCSTDDTVQIAKKFTKKYGFINFFQNPHNLGMDENFAMCVQKARGQFIWFCGQDDELLAGAVAKVLELLTKNPELGFMYLNYEQYDQAHQKIICPSMMDTLLVNKARTPLPKTEEVFLTPKSYFDFLSDVPTFLPATVIRKECWQKVDQHLFYGTHYIQYGVILSTLRLFPIMIVPHVYIRGLIPRYGWQKKPAALYRIAIGSMTVRMTAARNPQNQIPNHIVRHWQNQFMYNWPKLLFLTASAGFSPTTKDQQDLRAVLQDDIWYFAYFFPMILFTKCLFFLRQQPRKTQP